MKRIIKYFFLHYFAGKAMNGILSNENIYNAIVRLSKVEESKEKDITKSLVNLSYRYAREMVSKM